MTQRVKREWFWKIGGVGALIAIISLTFYVGRDVGATNQREKTNRTLIEALDARVGKRLDRIERELRGIRDLLQEQSQHQDRREVRERRKERQKR